MVVKMFDNRIAWAMYIYKLDTMVKKQIEEMLTKGNENI